MAPCVEPSVLAAALIVLGTGMASADAEGNDHRINGPSPAGLAASSYPDANLVVHSENGATVLRVDGVITPGFERRFLAALASVPQRAAVVVELASPGGFTGSGYRIIDRLLEERRAGRAVATRVRAGEACESMCVGVYLAGYPRYAAPSAEFMVHAPRIAGTGRVTLRSTRTMVDRLTSLGASAGWIERVKAAGGFSGMVDHRETAGQLAAERANVVTELIP